MKLARIRNTKESYREDISKDKHINYSVEFGERGKRKENDRTSVILHTIRCKGRGNKDVY
jgi:hypothetical protein